MAPGSTNEIKVDLEMSTRIEQLATYNAEKARGLVHTEEWKKFMQIEQEWYYQNVAGKRITRVR